MKKAFYLTMILILIGGTQLFSQDQNIKITKWVIGAGGMVNQKNSGGITMSGVFGQLAVEKISQDINGSTVDVYQGFWVPEREPATSVEDQPGNSNKLYSLNNFPNPLSYSTTIRFELPEEGYVNIRLYDALGNMISTIFEGYVNSGTNDIEWAARDNAGADLGSGTYLYEMTYKPVGNNKTFKSRNLMVILK